MFGVDFEILEPGQVADALHTIERRCREALAAVEKSGA
jgi:hypothetical protein